MSGNTVQDALLAKGTLDEFPLESVCVVTSHFHVARARFVFEHFFSPRILTVVGADNGVTPQRLTELEQQEKEKLERLQRQGGVIVNDTLLRAKE